jgi:hypothetical protein
MKLLNIRGDLLTSIQTKSGRRPGDIAVTRAGGLVYADTDNKAVNLVKNNQTRTVIILQGWVPSAVCFTASGDLLLTMYSIHFIQKYKVVRYCGYTDKQTIQDDG